MKARKTTTIDYYKSKVPPHLQAARRTSRSCPCPDAPAPPPARRNASAARNPTTPPHSYCPTPSSRCVLSVADAWCQNVILQDLAFSDGDAVPRFVRKCVEYIESNDGLDVEGLYRVSGNKV